MLVPRRRCRSAKTLLAGVALVVALAPFVSPAVAQDDLDSVRRDLAEARDEVEAARLAVAEAQAEANRAATELFAAHEEIESLDIAQDELTRRIDETSARRDDLAGAVRVVLVDQYVDGDQGADLLDDIDINRTARARALSRLVADSSLDTLDQYRAVRSELADLEADLADRRRRQAELVASLDESRAIADARLADLAADEERLDARAAELADLEALLEAEEAARRAEEERRRAEEERQRQADEQARRQAQATPTPTTAPEPVAEPDGAETPTATPVPDAPAVPDGTPPSPATGWVCPVAGPTSYIDSWGAPRSYGRWHKGTDMMAAEGTPVVAVVSGALEHRDNGIGGLSAHLQAADGTYFYYTHLSGYENVGAGSVSQGTVIGYVGQTGNATVPHLHFEHHPGGRGNPVNPYPTLIASC